MARCKQTKYRSRKSVKRNRSRKTKSKIIQKGGGLKENAIKILENNEHGDLDKFLFNSGLFTPENKYTVIIGDYTFVKSRDMGRSSILTAFKTSEPSNKVIIHAPLDY